MARPRARGKEIQLAIRESAEDVNVHADPLLMREVITNLINNAIDAAPPMVTSRQPPAAGAADPTSASPTTVPASRMSIATASSSPTSRPRRAAPDWASSCRTASFASIKVSFCSRARAAAPYSQWCFRRSPVDLIGHRTRLYPMHPMVWSTRACITTHPEPPQSTR